LPDDDKLCPKKCVFHLDAHDGYCDRLDKLEQQMMDLVPKLAVLIESFGTIKMIVYAGVGITLSTVLVGVLTLVLRSTK
jgi:hypothetical protein